MLLGEVSDSRGEADVAGVVGVGVLGGVVRRRDRATHQDGGARRLDRAVERTAVEAQHVGDADDLVVVGELDDACAALVVVRGVTPDQFDGVTCQSALLVEERGGDLSADRGLREGRRARVHVQQADLDRALHRGLVHVDVPPASSVPSAEPHAAMVDTAADITAANLVLILGSSLSSRSRRDAAVTRLCGPGSPVHRRVPVIDPYGRGRGRRMAAAPLVVAATRPG